MKKKRGPNNFKRFWMLLIVLLICFVSYYIPQSIPVMSAYYAKNLCSCVFVANRSAESVMQNELAPYSLIDATIDRDKKMVHTNAYGFFETSAYYRPGLGCTLLNGTTPEELDAQANGFTPYRTSTDTFKLKPFVQDSTLNFTLDRAKLQSVLNQEFQQEASKQTRAVVVLYDSLLVAEQYAEGFDKATPLIGWSMTKSITNALIGLLVRKGHLTVEQNKLLPDWCNAGDPRKQITLDNLLRMSSGLEFDEEYFLDSDATYMLFESAAVADLPMKKRLQYEPGTHWSYSSGTSNILAQIVRNNFGKELHTYWNFPQKELFTKLGITSMTLEPDPSGTFIGSSFAYATARDWAKLGLLYLKDGVWNQERILPEGWVNYTSTPTPAAIGGQYGAHFWMDAGDRKQEKKWKGVPKDMYYMSGFDGQSITIIPSLKLVIVRLSYSQANSEEFGKFLEGIIGAFK